MKKLIATLGLVGILGLAGCGEVKLDQNDGSALRQSRREELGVRNESSTNIPYNVEADNSVKETLAPKKEPYIPRALRKLQVSTNQIHFKKYLADENVIPYVNKSHFLTADFNNDGLADIAVIAGNNLIIYENTTSTNNFPK